MIYITLSYIYVINQIDLNQPNLAATVITSFLSQFGWSSPSIQVKLIIEKILKCLRAQLEENCLICIYLSGKFFCLMKFMSAKSFLMRAIHCYLP